VIYDVSHRTIFVYSQQVSISHHVLHLLPRENPRQVCLRSSLVVQPAPTVRTEGLDYFGNPVTHLMVQDPHNRLLVHASSQVEVQVPSPVALERTPSWETVARAIEEARSPAALEAAQFAFDSPYAAGIDETYAFARECFPPDTPVLAGAMAMTARIFEEFEYQGGVTDVSTPVADVLSQRRGVCQDFAHLQIACLRSLGLAARYVSGYLLTRPPPGQEKLVGSDASHAWIAVWSPDVGWVDFDPTNNMIPGDEHISLGWGRDYGDVSPINGFMIGGGSHEIQVAVDVNPAASAGRRFRTPRARSSS
jgi:transglutaminase-like putative cysteine protease